MALIDCVIGVKCAVSDPRSTAPGDYQLANMATESRVGGLLGGKQGVSVFHMGDSKKGLKPLYDILENSDVPMSKLLPTHVNRNEALFEEALAFALKGGTIDITSGIPNPVAPAEGMVRAVKAGIPLARITVSSDGIGSQPLFDDTGKLTGIGVGALRACLKPCNR